MKKTLLITIIAIVLIVSVAGTCFALYKQAATDKVVNISATSGAIITCNLDVTGSTSLDFSEISPADGHRTKTADVTLTSNNNSVAKGIAGIFKVTKAGDLAEYVDVTVNEIPSIGGNLGALNTDAVSANGATFLVTDNKCFRITMTLNDNGVASFASIAEKTGSITVSWTVDTKTTNLDYDADMFYVVGKVNGVTAWYPTTESIVLDTPIPNGKTDIAYKASITLHNGDEFKVVKGFRGDSPVWCGGKADNNANNNNVNGVQVTDNGGNIKITKDGTYFIYVNDSNEVWVDVQ